ncbi:MAG: sugar phosphate isomerase/epimerase family protein [Pyrinomonadaceae bacterium]
MTRAAVDIGFDAIDLTMRKGGHVAPENAERDLPVVAEIIRRAGLQLSMVTTSIVDTKTPHVEPMLRAMKAAGVTRYRWGGFKYMDNQAIPLQLERLKTEAAKLAELNRKYDVCAMYHTHSGAEVGASIWDLWVILKDLEGSAVSVNYDIAHATIEGGLGGWVRSAQLIAPWMRGVALKDFRWAPNAKGEWRPLWCPLGEGMVNFSRFLAQLKETNFSGPLQMHFEYPLGGADVGAAALSIDPLSVTTAMKRDLNALRGWLRTARLS